MITRLFLVGAMLIASDSLTFGKTYKNPTFGFQLEMPAGRVICTTEDGESDRGFIVLWQAAKCPPTDDSAGAYIYLEYNAAGWHSTFEEGKSICEGNAIRASAFVVSGFRFYRCKSMTDRGHASLTYFVLRNKMLSSPDNVVSYGVTLICPRDNCRPLLPMIRWLFAHMKFTAQDSLR